MIKAVIFDMDGLMYDTEPMIEKCWKSVSRHTRITMTEQTLSALRCRNSADREKYLKGIFGSRIDFKRMEKQMYRELHTRIATKGLQQKSGLWELLVYLKRCGYRLAVQTTNSVDTAAWYLEMSGCADFFDVVVAGRMVRKGKPEPDIFAKAVELLQLPAEECLVLEDSPAGVIAAHRADCQVIMIPDLDEPTRGCEVLAEAILDSMPQIIPFLRKGEHLPEPEWEQVRNIVFDFGGVVVNFNPHEYLRDRFTNKEIESYLYSNVFGSKLWLNLDAGTADRAKAEATLLKRATRDGYHFEMQTVLDEWRDFLTTKQDTVELLRHLKEKGYRLFYLSNIARDVFEMLSQREFMQLFEGGVTSWETNRLKPDAEIYQVLLKKYSLNPRATVFFDDTKENVDAANAVGMLGIRFHSASLAQKNLEGYGVL